MIRFKELIEATELYDKEQFKSHDDLDETGFQSHTIHHTVGDHHLGVEFNHDSDSGEAYVHFDVNHARLRGRNEQISPEHKMELLNKTRNSIESYIHHFKPKRIIMEPNESTKRPMYRAFAQHLAKRYGGKASEGRMNPLHVVSFK